VSAHLRQVWAAVIADMASYFDKVVEDLWLTPWIDDGVHIALDPFTWKLLPVESVSVHGLNATQTVLDQSLVDEYVANPERKSDGGDLPWVVFYKGEGWVLDGHHRVVAIIQQEGSTILAHVMRLNSVMGAVEIENQQLKMFSGKPAWEMTESEFRALESSLVYHSTSFEADYQRLLTEGVRMANVPNNLARQRYESGDYAEFAPGAGVGRGLYVSRPLYHVFGYGRYVVGIEVSMSDLDFPPESDYHRQYGTLESALNSHNGAMIVNDIPASRVHSMAERFTHEVSDAWQFVIDPRWTKR